MVTAQLAPARDEVETYETTAADETNANSIPPPKVVCGWCDRTLKDGSLPASHGICPRCMEEQRARFHVWQRLRALYAG